VVTYRALFAYREFRYLYAGQALSYLGDQVAAVAVAVLVFTRTNSALLTAVAYASAWLPGIVGGPILATYADRLPRRAVLITCDLARAALVALLTLPGVPLWTAIVLLYTAHLFSAPFTAARAAVMPEVLPGDAYVTGNGLSNITHQLSQLFGFVGGGVIVATIGPVASLLGNAATFAVSAGLIAVGMRRRPAAQPSGGPGLWAQSKEGIRLIAGDPWLRSCLALVCVASGFTFAPEAIAYPYAISLGGGPTQAGLLLAAPCVGFLLGALVLTRLVAPETRDRLLAPAAVLSTLALVPALVLHSWAAVLVLFCAAGAGAAFGAPLNAIFVRRVAPEFRGRAMGVASSALLGCQGLGFLASGAAVQAGLSPATVVGLSGAVGTAAVLALAALWRRAVAVTEPHTANASAHP
jgi:MFS family permease